MLLGPVWSLRVRTGPGASIHPSCSYLQLFVIWDTEERSEVKYVHRNCRLSHVNASQQHIKKTQQWLQCCQDTVYLNEPQVARLIDASAWLQETNEGFLCLALKTSRKYELWLGSVGKNLRSQPSHAISYNSNASPQLDQYMHKNAVSRLRWS